MTLDRREFLRLLSTGPLWLCLQQAMAATGPTGEEALPIAYRAIGQLHGVPPGLLYAIACNESSAWLTSRRVRPWPWTLNVEGRGERYASREDAHAAILRHLAAGRISTDIGLLQVNWKYHHVRLGDDPWIALEPLHNMAIGAQILREQYEASGEWWLAVGRYHSPGNPERAERYRAAIRRQFERLQQALAAERPNDPGLVWYADTGGHR